MVATLGLGTLLATWPGDGAGFSLGRLPTLDFTTLAQGGRTVHPGRQDRKVEIRLRFEQGVLMLHMREYRHALTAFHRVLELAPTLPEAHANAGFALLGLQQWKAARDFFESATALRRDQANAYYGLAVALDELGDRAGALGAMRTFLHRAPTDDPFRRKAEAALWEWESGAPAH